MKTYYDGEEREILEITPWYKGVYRVVYKRKEFVGELLLAAKDEIEVYQKFPAELERQSQNFNDDVEY